MGADPAGLRRAIQEQLALLGPPASGAAGGGSGGGPGPMATALAAALGRVKAGCSFGEFVAAAKTLLVFVGWVWDACCMWGRRGSLATGRWGCVATFSCWAAGAALAASMPLPGDIQHAGLQHGTGAARPRLHASNAALQPPLRRRSLHRRRPCLAALPAAWLQQRAGSPWGGAVPPGQGRQCSSPVQAGLPPGGQGVHGGHRLQVGTPPPGPLARAWSAGVAWLPSLR